MQSRISGIFGICCAALLLSACGGGNDSQDAFSEELKRLNEQAEQTQPEVDAGRSAMAEAGEASDPGVTSVTSVSLPEDFPEDVPLYPEMALSSVTGMSDTTMLQGNSDEPLETVKAFYQDEMRALGWEVDGGSGLAEIGMERLRFVKEGRQVDVNLTPSGNQTSINIALSVRF